MKPSKPSLDNQQDKTIPPQFTQQHSKQPIERARLLCLLLAGKRPQKPLSEQEWGDIYDIAAAQWLVGAFALAIKKLPKVYQPSQQEMIEFANEVLAFQIQREQDLHRNIALVNTTLKSVTPVLWLKGADDLLQATATQAGSRWMMDLDCLVDKGYFFDSWQRLLSSDYVLLDKDSLDIFQWQSELWHHAPNIIHQQENIAIELHRYVGRFTTRDILPEEECLARAKMVEDTDGNSCLVLAPDDGVIHRILHMQIMDEIEQKKMLSIRHAFHLFLYIEKHHDAINWQAVEARMQAAGYGDTLKRVVYFMDYLFLQKTALFDANCKVGRAFLKSINQSHQNTRISKIKKPFIIIFRALKAFLSPARVPKTYGKQPKGAWEWTKAYAHRFYLALKWLFKPGGIKKLYHIYKSEDW